MKKILYLLLCISFTLNGYAQNTNEEESYPVLIEEVPEDPIDIEVDDRYDHIKIQGSYSFECCMPVACDFGLTKNLNLNIVDLHSGEALIGAHIYIYGDYKFFGTFVSNIDGHFAKILPSGFYDIRITYLGYEPLELFDIYLELDKAEEIVAELEPGITLAEVVVKASSCLSTNCVTFCCCFANSTVTEKEEEREEITLAIPELTEVFPNPASHQVQVQSTMFLQSVALFDLRGNLLWSQNEINARQIEVPRNQLPAAQYLLRLLSTDSKQETIPIVFVD